MSQNNLHSRHCDPPVQSSWRGGILLFSQIHCNHNDMIFINLRYGSTSTLHCTPLPTTNENSLMTDWLAAVPSSASTQLHCISIDCTLEADWCEFFLNFISWLRALYDHRDWLWLSLCLMDCLSACLTVPTWDSLCCCWWRRLFWLIGNPRLLILWLSTIRKHIEPLRVDRHSSKYVK